MIKRSRIGNLLDFPFIEHHDLVPHRHRFDLVVCNVDHCGVESVVQATDLHPHLHAQLRIEVAQRFIEQEDFGMSDDRSTNGDALAFTTREVLRFTVQKV